MNLAIKNANGMLENIIVIRYFKFNGVNYLIFTKNEVDEAGYQKLYISRIVNMIGSNITDETEWNLIRDTIKVIAKSNKENTTLPVQDLNEVEVNGIQIIGQKPFKLTSASVAWLGANKNFAPAIPSAQSVQSISNMDPSVSTFASVLENTQSNTQPTPPSVMPEAVMNETSNLSNQNTITQEVIEPISQNIKDSNAVANNSSIMEASPLSMEMPSEQMTNGMSSAAPIQLNTTAEQNVSNFSGMIGSSSEVPNSSVQEVNEVPVQPDSLFDFSAQNILTPVSANPVDPVVDYKKLYDEQTLKLNTLTAELDRYKSLIEQLKNILQ